MERMKRNSNFELLRIIGMILIVGSHIVGHGVFLIYNGSDAVFSYYAEGRLVNCIIAGIFAPGGDMGNYIFFLLMGYFYNFKSSHEQRIKKILILTIEVYFYVIIAVILFVVPYLTGIYKFDDLGISGIIRVPTSMVLPMESECWWFITTYVFVFVIFGALSFLDKLPDKTFLKVLVMCFIIGLVRYNSGSYNKILQCGFVALIGVYIKKFVSAEKVEKKRILLGGYV